jgi:hypothetical protein
MRVFHLDSCDATTTLIQSVLHFLEGGHELWYLLVDFGKPIVELTLHCPCNDTDINIRSPFYINLYIHVKGKR